MATGRLGRAPAAGKSQEQPGLRAANTEEEPKFFNRNGKPISFAATDARRRRARIGSRGHQIRRAAERESGEAEGFAAILFAGNLAGHALAAFQRCA